jgi:threonine/homoserine/homoserine lactone efflux protein
VITAILIHISYCVAGLAVLIGTIPLLYNTLRYAMLVPLTLYGLALKHYLPLM